MKNKEFDEYQISLQKQLCLQTLILTLVLVVANGVISTFYTWASPFLQAFVILYVATIYFSVVAILKDVFFSNGQSNRKKYALIYFIASFAHGLPSLIVFATVGITFYFDNGMLKESALAPIGWFYFMAIVISLMVRIHRDEKEEECE